MKRDPRKKKKTEKDDEPEMKGKLIAHGKQIGKDILTAVIIVGSVMGVLYLYCGVWPPLVVVESRSMQHSNNEAYIGVIDTGDIVAVKKPLSTADITTYVKGRSTGYSTYGEFGDVIVYKKYGSDTETPVIHRAILYAVYDPSTGLFNVPELQELTYGKDWKRDGSSQSWKGISTLYLFDVGYGHKNITINLASMERYSGYVTMGDNAITNPSIDQVGIIPNKLIKFEWIIGKATGELPWFGLIKVCLGGSSSDKMNCERAPQNAMQGLWVSIGILVAMPVVFDVSQKYMERRDEDLKKGISRGASPATAAILNLILPGWGYLYANMKRWNLIGAYIFSLYFFLSLLVMYALGFPIIGGIAILVINLFLGVHVFILVKRKD